MSNKIKIRVGQIWKCDDPDFGCTRTISKVDLEGNLCYYYEKGYHFPLGIVDSEGYSFYWSSKWILVKDVDEPDDVVLINQE